MSMTHHDDDDHSGGLNYLLWYWIFIRGSDMCCVCVCMGVCMGVCVCVAVMGATRTLLAVFSCHCSSHCVVSRLRRKHHIFVCLFFSIRLHNSHSNGGSSNELKRRWHTEDGAYYYFQSPLTNVNTTAATTSNSEERSGVSGIFPNFKFPCWLSGEKNIHHRLGTV